MVNEEKNQRVAEPSARLRVEQRDDEMGLMPPNELDMVSSDRNLIISSKRLAM